MAKGLACLITLAKQNPHVLLTESWQAGKFTTTCEQAIAATALSEALVLGRNGANVPAGLPLSGGTAAGHLLISPSIEKAAQEPDGSFNRGRADWPASDATDPTCRQAFCTLILESFDRLSR